MPRYRVELSPRALRDLRKLGSDASAEVVDDLSVLGTFPWPTSPKVKKLRGGELYRIRTGEFRSIFERRGKAVVVLRVIDRKDFERILRRI